MEKVNKLLTKDVLFTLLFVIVALHPIIELDYWIYEIFSNIGLPRLTTIIDYIILPLLVVAIFILYEKNKKKTLIYIGVFALIFGVYFFFHYSNALVIRDTIHLTDNFVLSFKEELMYTFVLLLPLVYIYIFYISNLKENILKNIVILTSSLISWSIFISDIFTFGKSTYSGFTYDNIFSWFALPFDHRYFHPRRYACKFFFEEGNTIGILLLIILPLLYYFSYKEKNKKLKLYLYVLIFIQSISMIILSTRIATFGSILVPIAMFIVYIFLVLLKKEKLSKTFVIILFVNTFICGTIYPFCPAYQNQLIDASDYGIIKVDDKQKEEAKLLLKDADKLIKWSDEWRYFYEYIFEDYQFLINLTPPIYYVTWYSYKYDPEFWVDVIFDYPLEERVNGRQIETIFTKYKWDELNTMQKLTGFGYSTVMNGGILIERDFVQQYYSYGLIGSILIFAGWILTTIFAGIKVVIGYKKGRWNLLNITLLMSIGLGFVSSVVSGHTFDELTTSLFISLCLAYLLKQINTKNSEEI